MTADTAPRIDTAPPPPPSSGRCPAIYRDDLRRSLSAELRVAIERLEGLGKAVETELGAAHVAKIIAVSVASARIGERKLNEMGDGR